MTVLRGTMLGCHHCSHSVGLPPVVMPPSHPRRRHLSHPPARDHPSPPSKPAVLRTRLAEPASAIVPLRSRSPPIGAKSWRHRVRVRNLSIAVPWVYCLAALHFKPRCFLTPPPSQFIPRPFGTGMREHACQWVYCICPINPSARMCPYGHQGAHGRSHVSSCVCAVEIASLTVSNQLRTKWSRP